MKINTGSALRRTLALLLAGILLCSPLCASAGRTAFAEEAAAEAAETDTSFELNSEDLEAADRVYCFPTRTAVGYVQMGMNLYDEEEANAALEEMERICTEGPGNLKRLQELYDILIDAIDKIDTDYVVAYITYSGDCLDDDLADLENELDIKSTDLLDRFYVALNKVLASPYGDAMATYIGDEELVEDLRDYEGMTEEDYALIEEYNGIVEEYYELSAQDGDVGTEMAELYLRLLDNLIARCDRDDDYDNYAQMAYDGYYRDFSPEDTEPLRAFAREFASKYVDLFDEAAYDSAGVDYYDVSISGEDRMEMVKPYVTSVSEEAAEIWDMLESCRLYDLDPSENKNGSGYTITVPWYGTAFIFDTPYENAQDVQTVIHEFGHYYANVMNSVPDFYAWSSLDLDEVHSQGLEMLMMPYLDEIYGEELGETMAYQNLSNMLYAVITGCMFDELQVRALQGRMDGTINTAEELEDLILDVTCSYFDIFTASYYAENWYVVNHTFTSPFYYLSYATSATAALGILASAAENYDEAVRMYNQLVEISGTECFCGALDTVGLPDPLTQEGIDEIEDVLGSLFDSIC